MEFKESIMAFCLFVCLSVCLFGEGEEVESVIRTSLNGIIKKIYLDFLFRSPNYPSPAISNPFWIYLSLSQNPLHSMPLRVCNPKSFRSKLLTLRFISHPSLLPFSLLEKLNICTFGGILRG